MARGKRGLKEIHTGLLDLIHCGAEKRVRYSSKWLPQVNRFNMLVFFLGALINTSSYLSFLPIIVAVIFFVVGYLILVFTPLGGIPERRMYSRVYCVGFLMAGFAAIYANQLHDAAQLFGDPDSFFKMATGKAANLSIVEIQRLHEGSLAIVFWAAIYDFFSLLGFEKERHIGVSVNITAVALTGVIGIKIIQLIYGYDEYRFRRLTLLVAACGLFWLFASIHLRGALVLLAVSALIYAWTYFLVKPDFGWRLLCITLSSLLASIYIGFLRGEFMFVPVAFGVAALLALLIGKAGQRRRLLEYGVISLGGGALVILLMCFASEIVSILERWRPGYAKSL